MTLNSTSNWRSRASRASHAGSSAPELHSMKMSMSLPSLALPRAAEPNKTADRTPGTAASFRAAARIACSNMGGFIPGPPDRWTRWSRNSSAPSRGRPGFRSFRRRTWLGRYGPGSGTRRPRWRRVDPGSPGSAEVRRAPVGMFLDVDPLLGCTRLDTVVGAEERCLDEEAGLVDPGGASSELFRLSQVGLQQGHSRTNYATRT